MTATERCRPPQAVSAALRAFHRERPPIAARVSADLDATGAQRSRVDQMRRYWLQDRWAVLVIPHGILALASSWFVPTADFPIHLATIVFVAVLFSQMSLLGLRIGLGTTSWQRRLGGFLFGLVYVSFPLACVISPRAKTFGDPLLTRLCSVIAAMALLLCFSTAAIMLVARRWNMRVGRLRPGVRQRIRNEMQFTIAQLMLLTTAVATLLALGQSLRDHAEVGVSGHGPVLFVVTFVFCLTIVSLAAAWAALGSGSPLTRSVLVVALAVCMGLIPPYYFRWSWHGYVAVPATICLQTMITLVSLLVVRSWGYRLLCTPSLYSEVIEDSGPKGPGVGCL